MYCFPECRSHPFRALPDPLHLGAVDDETGSFVSDPALNFAHPYPATKIMFIPDKDCVHPDLMATTGDYLRIWQVKDEGVQLLKLLNNVSALLSSRTSCTQG